MRKVVEVARNVGLKVSLALTAPVVLPLKVLPIKDPVTRAITTAWDFGYGFAKAMDEEKETYDTEVIEGVFKEVE